MTGVLLSVNVQGVRASSGGEDGVSAEHREQSGRGLRSGVTQCLRYSLKPRRSGRSATETA